MKAARYPRDKAVAQIDDMLAHIERVYGVTARKDSRYKTSSCNPVKKNFQIGTKGFGYQGITKTVPAGVFVRIVLNIYHEERHLQQYALYKAAMPKIAAGVPIEADDLAGWPDDERTRRVLGYYAAGRMTEFRRAIYMRDPTERDAELYAIEKTRKLFKNYYPDIDVDRALVDIIGRSSVWYAAKADTASALESNLLNGILNTGELTPLKTADFAKYVTKGDTMSPMAVAILSDPNRCANFDSSDFMDLKAAIAVDVHIALDNAKSISSKPGSDYSRLADMPSGDEGRDDPDDDPEIGGP